MESRDGWFTRALGRIPSWGLFVLALVVMVGGLAAIGAIAGPPSHPNPKEAILRVAPLWVLALAPVIEAFLWTIVFVEGFARLLRSPAIGMACGLLAYSAIFHASQGVLAVASSAWLGLVCGVTYLLIRTRSRWKAALAVVGLRWCFIALGFVSVGGMSRFGFPPG